MPNRYHRDLDGNVWWQWHKPAHPTQSFFHDPTKSFHWKEWEQEGWTKNVQADGSAYYWNCETGDIWARSS